MSSNASRALLAAVFLVGACADGEAPAPPEGELRNLPLQTSPEVAAVQAPLPEAFCEVQVDGRGRRDVETDYLPRVLACEAAHAADLDALKALAVAARSVTYYAMAQEGSICDGQGCQVYGCGKAPDPIHVQAVEETQGVYLMSHGTLTYGFYVAGDSTPDAACVGNSGTTEKWVTYNEGRSGTDVTQTRLGWRHAPGDPGYGQNRGCFSQWGSVCLEDQGRGWQAILRFYYGDDIEIVQAQGDCIEPLGDGDESSGEDDGGHEESGTCGDDGPITPREDQDDGITPGDPDRGGVEGCRAAAPPTGMTALLLLLLSGLTRRRRRFTPEGCAASRPSSRAPAGVA
jgi:uncharacterized protein (TIGR03382 family)